MLQDKGRKFQVVPKLEPILFKLTLSLTKFQLKNYRSQDWNASVNLKADNKPFLLISSKDNKATLQLNKKISSFYFI